MGKDVTNVLQLCYKYFMNESEKLKMKKPTNSCQYPDMYCCILLSGLSDLIFSDSGYREFTTSLKATFQVETISPARKV